MCFTVSSELHQTGKKDIVAEAWGDSYPYQVTVEATTNIVPLVNARVFQTDEHKTVNHILHGSSVMSLCSFFRPYNSEPQRWLGAVNLQE